MTPTRSTRFLTFLATLSLVAAITAGLFAAAGAVFGFGPNGHDVVVHGRVPANELTLPPGSVTPDDVKVAVTIRDAGPVEFRWVLSGTLRGPCWPRSQCG